MCRSISCEASDHFQKNKIAMISQNAQQIHDQPRLQGQEYTKQHSHLTAANGGRILGL